MQPEPNQHWLAAPKNRALYHLLQVTGTALEESLPGRSQQISVAKESLTSVRSDQQGTTLTIQVDDELREVVVPRDALRFYRRGDVSAMVARRDPTIDDRTQNWDAAIALWGDWLGLDQSERDLATKTKRRLAPTPDVQRQPASPLTDWVLFGVIALATAAAWWTESVLALCGLSAAAITFALTNSTYALRRIVAAGGAAAISIAVSHILMPDVNSARSAAMVVFGLTAATLAARLADLRDLAAFAMDMVAGLLLGGTGVGWVFAGLVIVAFDALTTAVGANRRPYWKHLVSFAALTIGAIITGTLWAWRQPETVGVEGASGAKITIVLVVVIVAAIVYSIVDFVNGIRHSLANLALPWVAIVGTIASSRANQASLLAALLGALVAATLSLARPQQRSAAGAEHAATPKVESPPRPPAQPVSLRSRNV